MPKPIDLRNHKVQIADCYRLKSEVMVRTGVTTGGWARIIDYSGKVVTILKINQKSLTVALRAGPKVSVFTIVTKGRSK